MRYALKVGGRDGHLSGSIHGWLSIVISGGNATSTQSCTVREVIRDRDGRPKGEDRASGLRSRRPGRRVSAGSPKLQRFQTRGHPTERRKKTPVAGYKTYGWSKSPPQTRRADRPLVPHLPKPSIPSLGEAGQPL